MLDAVIVTGSAGGIGRVLCREFANAGYLVVSLDKSSLDQGDLKHIEIDLTTLREEDSRQSLQSRILELLDKDNANLKTIVNNAAVQLLGNFEQLEIRDFETSLFINLTVPLIMGKLFYQQLTCNKGNIVNIGSIHSNLTKPAFVSYATSKAGLNGLTRAMAVDLGGTIRVNCILPGAIETPMLRAGFAKEPSKFEELKRYHPTGNIGTPKDVASLALYLASDRSEFLNGSCVRLDGAIGARLHDPL